jgi:hypothetical protein
METLNQSRIPVRMRRQELAGLDDLVDDYSKSVQDFSDAYVWLMKNRQVIAQTNSSLLLQKYDDLMLKGEGLRQLTAAYHLEPSVTGFIDNIVHILTGGAAATVGGVTLSSSELSGIVHELQNYIAEVKQLELNAAQVGRLIASGVPASQAVAAVEQSQMGFFEKLGSAVKWPAIGIGAVLLIGAFVIFAPEIKAGFRALKRGR